MHFNIVTPVRNTLFIRFSTFLLYIAYDIIFFFFYLTSAFNIITKKCKKLCNKIPFACFLYIQYNNLFKFMAWKTCLVFHYIINFFPSIVSSSFKSNAIQRTKKKQKKNEIKQTKSFIKIIQFVLYLSISFIKQNCT